MEHFSVAFQSEAKVVSGCNNSRLVVKVEQSEIESRGCQEIHEQVFCATTEGYLGDVGEQCVFAWTVWY